MTGKSAELPRLAEIGDEFTLVRGSWGRKVRVVRVTETGPYTREYTLREIDGHHVFQSEADEEKLDPSGELRAHALVQGRLEGHEDAQGRHHDREQVGVEDGSRFQGWQQADESDFPRPSGEGGRQEADGEGFDGSVGAGRVRPQQAGLADRGGGALAEGPVLGSSPAARWIALRLEGHRGLRPGASPVEIQHLVVSVLSLFGEYSGE